MRNRSILPAIGAVVGYFVLIVILSAALAFPVMLLWNGTLTEVFPSVNSVTFMQAWGLNLLAGFLFKGSGWSSSSKD